MLSSLLTGWPDWLRGLVAGLIAATTAAVAAYLYFRRPGPPRPRPPRPAGMVAAFLAIALAILAGCARPTDAAVIALNGSQRVMVDANAILAEQHRRDRDDAVVQAKDALDAKARIDVVHATYRPRWEWYERIRSAWAAAAAIVRAAQLTEIAGGKPDIDRVRRATLDVAAALEAFAATLAPTNVAPRRPSP